MNRLAVSLLALSAVLAVVGVALYSPRAAVLTAALVAALLGVAQIEVSR